MEILTNRFKIRITNYSKYQFIRYEVLETEADVNNKHIKRSHLIKTKFKNDILAIIITNSKGKPANLYILLNKDFDINQLDEALKSDYKRVNQIYENYKKSLLLASLSKNEDDIHNLSGKIWQVTSLGTHNKKIIFKYQIYDDVLYQTLETMYHKNEFEQKEIREYLSQDVFYSIYGLQITVANKNQKDVYLKKRPKRYNNTKSDVTFLEIDDFGGKYLKCKTHYYHKFMEIIKRQLGEVLSIEHDKQHYDSFNGRNLFANKENQMIIQNIVVDSKYYFINKTNKDNQIVYNRIAEHANKSGFFFTKKIDYQTGLRVSKNKMNIRVVKSKNYYKNNKLVDQYKNYKSSSVQHLVYDEMMSKAIGESGKSAYGTIMLIDVQIKADIIKRKINIISQGLEEYENWIFILKAKNKNKDISYHSLQIIHNNLFFSRYHPSENEKERIDFFAVEGIIKIDNHFIRIVDTDEIPMVNYNEIEKVYETMFSASKIEINDIINILKEVKREATDLGTKAIDTCINTFEEFQLLTCTPKDIINKIKPLSKVKLKTKFIKQLYLETKQLIMYPVDKNKLYKLFENINYKYQNQKLRYYVPYRSINDIKFNKISHAFRIKEVSGLHSSQIDKYLELLETDIVRINRDSIVPFQFKYLREYLKMNNLTPISKSN